MNDLETLRKAICGEPTENQFFPYAFYQLPIDGFSVVRFLPDANRENPLGFLVKVLIHQRQTDTSYNQIICNATFKRSCMVCQRGRELNYQAHPLARQLARKSLHYGQCLVLYDGLPGSEKTGTVQTISLSTQVFSSIQKSIEHWCDIVVLPYGIHRGYNFKIVKKFNVLSGYADYTSSHFDPYPSSLDQEESELAKASLIDLSELVPPKATEEQQRHYIDAVNS